MTFEECLAIAERRGPPLNEFMAAITYHRTLHCVAESPARTTIRNWRKDVLFEGTHLRCGDVLPQLMELEAACPGAATLFTLGSDALIVYVETLLKLKNNKHAQSARWTAPLLGVSIDELDIQL